MRRLTVGAFGLVLSFFCLTLVTAPKASAGVLKLEFDGFAYGEATMYQSLANTSRNARAGMFNLQLIDEVDTGFNLNSTTEVHAFCIELDQFMTTNAVVDYQVMRPADFFTNKKTMSLIGSLYDGFFASLAAQTTPKSQSVFSAAFQAALWEILYDTNDLNLSTGNYQVNNGKSTQVVAQANNFLSQLAPGQSQTFLTVLQSNTSQDLLIVEQIDLGTVNVSAPYLGGLIFFGFIILVSRKRASA